MRPSPKSLLILLPGIIWGVSFIWIELVLPYIEPITITMLRAAISVIALYPAMVYTGSYFPKTLREWMPFFWLSAANQAVPFALTAWGQKSIEAGLASILLSAMPLFTVLLAATLIADERLTRAKVTGMVLGLVGIVILIGPSALEGLGLNLWAQLAVLVSALLYALGAIGLRKVYPTQPQDMSPWALRLRIANAQFVMSVVMLLPFSLLFEAPWTMRPPLAAWGYMLLMGIGVTVFATLVYFYLIEEFGAGRASMTVYLIPVAGVLSGVVFLGEALTASMIAALALILCGVFIVNRSAAT